MEESRSVTSWVNRLYFEWPRALSFLGLRLVKTRHKNLVPLLFGVKPHPRVGSGRYSGPINVKCPLAVGAIGHRSKPRIRRWNTNCVVSIRNHFPASVLQNQPRKHAYRHIQGVKLFGSGIRWVEGLLAIGTGYQVFNLILVGLVCLSAGFQIWWRWVPSQIANRREDVD